MQFFSLSMNRRSLLLKTILLVALLKGLLWAFAIPPLETPDEQAHFAYVQYVAEQHRVPVVGTIQNGVSPELNDFGLAVNLAAVAHNPDTLYTLDRHEWNSTLIDSRHSRARMSGGSTYVAGYPPVYYWMGSIFYNAVHVLPIDWRFYSVRILSVLMGLVTAWAAFRIGGLIWPQSNAIPAVLAVLSSLQPMYSMISASVNNDNAVIMFASLSLWWTMDLLGRDNVPAWFLFLGGVLCGLALLTKAEAVYVVFATFVGILIYVLHRPNRLSSGLQAVVWVGIPMAVIYSPWAIFSLRHYGSILGTMGFQTTLPGSGSLSSYIASNFLGSVGLMHQFGVFVVMYWADFGWLDTTFPNIFLYLILFGLTIVGLVGTILLVFKRGRGKLGPSPRRLHLAYLVSYILGNVAFLYAVEYQYFHTYHTTMLQGRYLLTSLVPINAVIVLGIYALMPRRFRPMVGVALVIGAVVFNFASLYLQLQRFYWGGLA